MRVPAIIRFALSGLLLSASAGSAWAAEIILYDHRSFGGGSLTLHESAPDLDDYDFDNKVSAVRVISGTWELFRDDDYESRHGPSRVLGPGDYPNLSHVDFKRNKLSSVRLISDDSNGNGQAQADCPAPYHLLAPDGVCIWWCGPGTRPGANQECECLSGLVETGEDEFGRRVCAAPHETTQPDCQGPYHVLAPDGRCVWSCSAGTQPSQGSGECECQSGLVETGQDQFGRRVCTAPPEPTPPAARADCIPFDWREVRVSNVNGSWKLVEGSMWMLDFGANQAEANRSRSIIRHYRMSKQCFVGRPNPSMKYWLRGDRAPIGSFQAEDCVRFNLARTEVRQVRGSWKIVEGSHWIMDFGAMRAEAVEALAIMNQYGFRSMCYVGRPNPSMTYFRR